MKYVIEDTTLNAIGDAVRAKGNTEDKILVSDLATAINNLPTGGGGEEPFVLTGDATYAFSGPIATYYFNKYGNTMSSSNITNAYRIVYESTITRIPFTLNLSTGSLQYAFMKAYYLTEAPTLVMPAITNLQSTFEECYRIREFPEGYFEAECWNWEKIHQTASAGGTFASCYSLRRLPETFFKNFWNIRSDLTYKKGFVYCYNLDEIKSWGVSTANITSNTWSSSTNDLCRIKEFTFAVNEDGTPKTANWKNQTIELNKNTGYCVNTYYISNYNSGITADTRITDDATYQAYKDHIDSWTTDINYSRYNHDSAVNTINSLPDTSAYLATAGGTNTIKFQGAAGAKTDGGAINTLTEEEIAVAAAKGWTVSLS